MRMIRQSEQRKAQLPGGLHGAVARQHKEQAAHLRTKHHADNAVWHASARAAPHMQGQEVPHSTAWAATTMWSTASCG
jgi:hypothetical protein